MLPDTCNSGVSGNTEGVLATRLAWSAKMPILLKRLTFGRAHDRLQELIPIASFSSLGVAGDYTVWASRGFEWEPASLELSLVADQSLDWQPELIRAYETPGWVAADFHLHSEWSPDSDVPLRQRILACVCEGIEYAVATDHDVITDYAPFVADALKPLIQVAIGLEVTTPKIGHLNVWPLTLNPNKPGHLKRTPKPESRIITGGICFEGGMATPRAAPGLPPSRCAGHRRAGRTPHRCSRLGRAEAVCPGWFPVRENAGHPWR